MDSKIQLANEMASGAMVGTGGGDSRRCSKDIVFRVWIIGVMSMCLSKPLSFWRVFSPAFFGAPVNFWGVEVATIEYVTRFGFIDAMVVVLGPAQDGCKAIVGRTAEAAREKGVGAGSCSTK